MISSNSKYILTICLILSWVPFAAHSASKETYVAGQDYIKLPAEIRKNQDVAQLLENDPKKVQVIYFFSYGCSACAKFNPSFEKWAKAIKQNVVIYKNPVSFHEGWESLAKLYYVSKDLAPSGELNQKIFNAIHEQSIQLWQEPEMQEFFVANGFTADQFQKLYTSFGINAEVNNAEQISVAYAITQTPTIIINGIQNSYKLTIDKANHDLIKFFKIVDYIISKQP